MTIIIYGAWLAASATALGFFVLRIVGLDFSTFAPRAFAAFWLGFCGQLILLLGASALIPLALLILYGPTGLLFFRPWQRTLSNSVSVSWVAFAGFFALLICGAATNPHFPYDTGLYHYPLTLWYREYGAVHGLALLHHRFGFTSSVFAAAAALDLPPLDSRLIHLPIVVTVCVSALYAVAVLRSVLAGSESTTSLFWPAVC